MSSGANNTVPITYLTGLVHPESWIHDNDQVLLLVGTVWWFTLAAVFLMFFLCAFSRIYKYPMYVSSAARIIVMCALLGVAYMYTSARELLFVRDDDVYVRTPLVVINGAINVVLIYVGSKHCVLHPTYDEWVIWMGALGTAQTTLASFVPAAQQWPGWVVGALFYVPIPFMWITQHRRPTSGRVNMHVVAWTMMWLVYRTMYALLQLSGHTFAAADGLKTTTELALMLVLHTVTLVPLVYGARYIMAPPRAPGKYRQDLENGDRVAVTLASGRRRNSSGDNLASAAAAEANGDL